MDDDPMDGSGDFTEITNKRSRASTGTSNTEGTVFKHEVLTSIGISENNGRVNLYKTMLQFTAALFETCVGVILISANGKFKITKREDFPGDKKSFKEFFNPVEEWTNNPRNKHCGAIKMKMTISSMKTLGAIKSGEFLQYLKNNDIYLRHHILSGVTAAKFGLLTKRHPEMTNIPKLEAAIRATVDKEVTDGMVELPEKLNANTATEIFARVETITHHIRSEDPAVYQQPIKTEVICLYTNAAHASALAALISSAGILSEDKFGHFLPWMAKEDKELFADKLLEHTASIARMQSIKLEGVTREMMQSTVTYRTYTGTCEELIRTIRSLEPQKPDLPGDNVYQRLCQPPEETHFTDKTGRWLIPYSQEKQKEVKQLVAHLIEHWNKLYTESDAFEEPPRILSRTTTNPVQDYINKQRERGIPKYVADNRDKYTTLSKNRRVRPPIVIEVEAKSATSSWASVVKGSSISTLGASQRSPPARSTQAATHSVASADTTTHSNRSDLESVITQMKQDQERAIKKLQTETEQRYTQMEKKWRSIWRNYKSMPNNKQVRIPQRGFNRNWPS